MLKWWSKQGEGLSSTELSCLVRRPRKSQRLLCKHHSTLIFKLEASPVLDLLENCRVYPDYIPGKVVCIALAPVAFHWEGTIT